MLVFQGYFGMAFASFILGAPHPTLNPQLQHAKNSCGKNVEIQQSWPNHCVFTSPKSKTNVYFANHNVSTSFVHHWEI